MSYFYIITLFAGLVLSACSDTNTTKSPTPATPSTTSESITPPSVEAIPVATTDEPKPEDIDAYDQERKIINDFVDQVNRDLAQLTLKERKITFKENTYDILHYTDANGVLVKAKAVCEKDSWEIYTHPDAHGPKKRIYASYMAVTDNPYEPISKQYYHIGSMKERDQLFLLVLDEAVEPITNNADREAWIAQYKSAATVITQP